MQIKDVTIVMPTSVSPSHPDTEIIDQVISSIRKHFPENEIILQIDGLRDEQHHRKEQYDEYKNRILWKCLHEWKNVLPIVFDEHSHQSTMMEKTIDLVKTPVIFYVEGDVSIRDNVEINWQDALDLLRSEKAYTVRFYSFNVIIEPGHWQMMFGQEGDFIKTFQWSQQPHFSLTSYYRNMVIPNTTPKLFIEDKFYGKVFVDCHEDDNIGWNDHRLWLYNPVGKDDIRVFLHLDGRQGLRKFTGDDEAWGLTEA
jgi:hypothetical protein